MSKIIKELIEHNIHPYGSKELLKFEKNMEKYFAREYKLHLDNDCIISLNQGPLALASEELADSHYDEGIPFFKTFLDDETMSYTMAFFDDLPEKALISSKSLEQAQMDKFQLIAERMKLKGNEHVLNIGCGFAYFESYLLKTYPNIKVSSITHSKDQYNLVKERCKNLNDILSSKRFHLYFGEVSENTSVQLGEKKYDAVCSVGLLEQINNIDLFFSIINELLAENGVMFHHLIVSRDLIPQFLDPQKTLIGDYFPGGKVLPFNALKNNSFKGFSIEESWFINGTNYWRTLDYWHSNFWVNIHNIYPDKMNKERVAYWNNYFVLCKAMFFPETGKAYGNGQYLFNKI